MVRIFVVGAILLSAVFIWKSGALDSVLGGGGAPTTTGQDATVALNQTHDAMKQLQSVHVNLTGTAVFTDLGEVALTGSGDLLSAHKESLSLQFQVPGKGILPLKERMESGHLYIQTEGSAWKDVTGNPSGQLLPELDPLSNIQFLQSARASDEMGQMTMDNISVQHLSLNVDGERYIEQLKADPLSGVSAADETALANAGIHVEVWVSPHDHYIHQMHIEMTASQFSWDVTYRFSNFVTGSGSASA